MALAAGGCPSTPSQTTDGGQDHVNPNTDVPVDSPIDSPTFEAVPTDTPADVFPDLPPDAPPTDALPDLPADAPPFASSRSFVVTSRLHADGGTGPVTAHIFTMVLDSERRLAIVGAAGEGSLHALEPVAGGALRFSPPVRLALPASCPGSTVTYSDLRFAIDATGGLTGTGEGEVLVTGSDTNGREVRSTTAATMSLAGVADLQPPRLDRTGDAPDPFASITVIPSEPLPPGSAMMLRAANGETIDLPAVGVPGTFVHLFQKPAQVLRYATEYTFVVAGPIADFAGNPATALIAPTFTTRARPPLAAEDGFEGVTTATFGGVRVISGADSSTISGAKSLYIPPVSSGMTQPPLALRLQVSPGDSTIRFSYRIVPGTPGFTSGVAYVVGSEGGPFTEPPLPADPGPTTTTEMVDGAQVPLGPIMTATFALPTGATTEVVLTRTQRLIGICGVLIPSIAGIIIDDLRVE